MYLWIGSAKLMGRSPGVDLAVHNAPTLPEPPFLY